MLDIGLETAGRELFIDWREMALCAGHAGVRLLAAELRGIWGFV